MHAVLTGTLSVIAAAACVVGSVTWLGYKAGQWRSADRIAQRLKNDRDFGIAILEELAERWGVKIVRQETPGGS